MLRRISRAATLDDRPILLGQIYAFARRRSGQPNDAIVQRMKLLTLLGHRITFAGSALLDDEFVWSVFSELRPLFESGVITPDLRAEAESFEHLASLKGGTRAQRTVRRARELDQSVLSVISFEPIDVSGAFAHQLSEAIGQAIGSADSKLADTLYAVKERIATWPGQLSLADIRDMARTISQPNHLLRAAEILYCTTGADDVGASASLPGYFVDVGEVSDAARTETNRSTDEVVAFATFLERYALSVDHLRHVNASDILAMREDRRVEQAATILRHLVKETRALSLDEGRDAVESMHVLQNAVTDRCRSEARRDTGLRWLADIAWDAGAPLSNIASRVIRGAVTKIARSRASILAHEFTPLAATAAIVRDVIVQHQLDCGSPN
jgi:hypothetical protein